MRQRILHVVGARLNFMKSDDVRESPALDVIDLLRQKGADVRYYDPYVPSIRHNGFQMQGETDLDAALAAADCAVVVMDHASYDWAAIRQWVRLLVDTRHATED
jgi:UDP-N-acetyl-D-glucosamine dehydrogenase